MKLPKFYLIQSNLSEEDRARVREALSAAPSTGTFVFSDEDAKLAQEVTEAPVMTFSSPMAIVGTFPAMLTVVNSDGSVENLL